MPASSKTIVRGWGAVLGLEDVRKACDARRRASFRGRLLSVVSVALVVSGLVVVSAGDAPHICAISLPGYPSQVVVRYLSDQGFCLSAGSACHRGKASHVYAAINLSKPVRDGMLRVSFGPSNTKEEVDKLAQALLSVTQSLVAAGR